MSESQAIASFSTTLQKVDGLSKEAFLAHRRDIFMMFMFALLAVGFVVSLILSLISHIDKSATSQSRAGLGGIVNGLLVGLISTALLVLILRNHDQYSTLQLITVSACIVTSVVQVICGLAIMMKSQVDKDAFDGVLVGTSVATVGWLVLAVLIHYRSDLASSNHLLEAIGDGKLARITGGMQAPS
jgi:hypothetical protein